MEKKYFFDIRELRDLVGNPTNDFKIHLLKNGVLVQELGVFPTD